MHGRFVCAIYVYSMFCVYVCTCMHVFVCVLHIMYVFVCICICICIVCICIVCMSSPPRTLLLANLLPKYPYFSSIPFVYAVFGVVGNFFFVFFFLSIYLCYLLRWWCIMIVFKIGSIRWNANVRTYFRSYKTSYNLFSYI